MKKYQTLSVDVDGRGVANVRLNRPDKRNSLSAEMIDELTTMARTFGASDEIRAIVLGASGKLFCAGGDLAWMKAQIEADREARMRAGYRFAGMLAAMNEMPKPLIGRIHGGAYGGGVGLICVCDVAISDDGARFGLTETRLGLIPATIGPYVLARLGEGQARRVFMSSRIFGAAEARDIGLIADVVAADELDAAVAAQVEPYLKVAPHAVGAAKALARYLGPRIDDAVISETVRRLADSWEQEEAIEGINAFLAGRPARWS